MATYNEILDTQLDPDAPITSSLGYQFRDNPIAILEYASGAPRPKRKITGADGTTVTFSGLDSYSGLEATIFWNGFSSNDTQTLDVEFSNNGSTWYGTTTLLSFAAQTGNRVADFWVDFNSAEYGIIRMNMAEGGNTAAQAIARHDTGTITGLTLSATHVRFVATGGSDMAVKLMPNGGIA